MAQISLITANPIEGLRLAAELARFGYQIAHVSNGKQNSASVPDHCDIDRLLMASQVGATYFDTIAAANDFWRSAMSGHEIATKGNAKISSAPATRS